MHELPRVLFDVDARDPNVVIRAPVIAAGAKETSCGNRLLVLRDLIALGQIRIEVILPREDRRLVDRAAESQRGTRCEVDGAAVENGQRARQPEANGTDVRVGRRAERGAAGTKDFRRGQELGVNLEADDRLILDG